MHVSKAKSLGAAIFKNLTVNLKLFPVSVVDGTMVLRGYSAVAYYQVPPNSSPEPDRDREGADFLSQNVH